jgi:hypothetical protein
VTTEPADMTHLMLGRDEYERHNRREARRHRSDPELEATLQYLRPCRRTVLLSRMLAKSGERCHRYVWKAICERLDLAFADMPPDDVLITIASQSKCDPVVLDFRHEVMKRAIERAKEPTP